jgi:cytochrome c biogenesis protein CcdA
MMAVTSVFFERYEDLIGKVLGAVILVLGIINVKDLVVPGKGPSLAVPAARKAAIVRRFSRIVDLLKRNSILAIALGVALTMVLSIGVNLVELGCTAILPAVYMTSVLRRFGSSVRAPHVLWTVFYAGIYVLPLLFLLANFILTFRSRRMTERQGRTLKIVGGFVMIAFALVMIVKPELLSFT